MDRTAVGAVSGDVRRDRRGDRPLPLFSEVPLRRLRGDVPNLRAGETCAPALRRKLGKNKGAKSAAVVKVRGEASAGSEKKQEPTFRPAPSSIKN